MQPEDLKTGITRCVVCKLRELSEKGKESSPEYRAAMLYLPDDPPPLCDACFDYVERTCSPSLVSIRSADESDARGNT